MGEVVSIGCQCHWTWNQLAGKPLGSLKHLLSRVFNFIIAMQTRQENCVVLPEKTIECICLKFGRIKLGLEC